MGRYLKATTLVAGLTLATNLLGMGREVLFARAFGVGPEADAYVTAFSIVAVCFLVVSAGALQGAFMPRFQRALVHDEPAVALGLWRSTLWLLLGGLMLVALALALGAKQWVAWVVPGFDGPAQAKTEYLLRWLAPMVVFVGVGSLLQSVTHAYQRFFLPSIVPLLTNVVIIVSLLLLVPKSGILGLALGTLLGAGLWLMLLPGVLRELPTGEGYLPPGELRALGMTMLPLLVLLASDQGSALVQKALVSDLEVGSIAVLNYAAKIEGLPVGIFAAAISTVFFPALVEALSRFDRSAAVSRFVQGLGAVCFCAIPASVLLVQESHLVVQVLLQRGAFDPQATARAAHALFWYALGILPQSLIVFINRIYFAAGDTRRPMWIGMVSATLHVLFCWGGVRVIGYLGIAIGTTLYALIYSIMLLVFLRTILPVTLPALWRAVWRAILAGGVMAGGLHCWDVPQNIAGLMLALTGGAAVYLLSSYLLGEPLLHRRPINLVRPGLSKIGMRKP